MRLQDVGTVETVVPKRDDLAEARKGKLTDRLHELEHATSQGFVLVHTVVLEGEQYATFVDTLIQDRSAL
ncbi:hypothetical protein BIU98_00330 [Curtobacterium sp. MMLR14_010]|uniref:hypothetical protein n=1 Tax=Curtobacterium sp. MMLR14_010 TaxID=1898743 RepID=UPI0008DCC3C9|nr:hypothetical protein [Curtobacterium sp. MMLR14_010]OII36035.1 hypothetical protein BIU98_00330 [Curtobacterium sp. MMLR14_010]